MTSHNQEEKKKKNIQYLFHEIYIANPFNYIKVTLGEAKTWLLSSSLKVLAGQPPCTEVLRAKIAMELHMYGCIMSFTN